VRLRFGVDNQQILGKQLLARFHVLFDHVQARVVLGGALVQALTGTSQNYLPRRQFCVVVARRRWCR